MRIVNNTEADLTAFYPDIREVLVATGDMHPELADIFSVEWVDADTVVINWADGEEVV